MSKKILNYRYISRKLTGKDFLIRSNFVPKKYKEKVNELEKLVDGWENLESDDNKWFVDNLLKDTIQAIEVIRCCEELKSKETMTLSEFKDINYENWGNMYRCIKDRTFYAENDVIDKHKEYCSL